MTTWEGFNYILKGLTDQMIRIGASPNIRITVFQLWTHYLRLHQAAFFSKGAPTLPKIGFTNNFRDRQLLYNFERKPLKVYQKSEISGDGSTSNRAKKRKLTSLINLSQTSEYNSLIASQRSLNASSLADLSASEIRSLASSASSNASIELKYSQRYKDKMLGLGATEEHLQEHANDFEGKLKCCKVNKSNGMYISSEIMTINMLLAFIHLALDIHETKFTLSDLIRFSWEGHLSMYECDHFFPSSILAADVKLFKGRISQGTPTNFVSSSQQREKSHSLAKTLDVNPRIPDIYQLCIRYIDELALPKDMIKLVARIIAFCEPRFKRHSSYTLSKDQFYEGRAIAYIIFVLKLLFGLNGETENLISGMYNLFIG